MGRKYLESGDYAMREIEEDDLSQLLAWRNSPEVHSKMLTDHIITWDEHMEWFKKAKKQNPPLNFAFTYKGKLAGYLGYPKYDSITKICDVGDYLGTDLNLPVDAGAHMGNMLLQYAFNYLKVKKIITEVFVDNRRVLKIIQFSGFKKVKEYEIEKGGELRKIAILELNFNEWKY